MQLNGEHIFVKSVEESDVESLLALEVKNKNFFQLFTGVREESFYTNQGQLNRIKSEIESGIKDKGYLFLIGLQKSGEIIGEIFLSEVVRDNLQSCWIGYFLDKEQNGKGFMTEAVKLVVNHAFKELDFHRIEAGVMPHNTGSIKVLLKAGFHKEGIARKNVKINGYWEDHQTLAIIKDESIDKVDKKVHRKNPTSIAPPIGPYTHLTTVPSGAELVVLSGQVGTDIQGDMPSDMNKQIDNTFHNILSVLNSQSVSVENIIKVNIWATDDMDWDYFHKAWKKFHSSNKPPSMTMSYVPALAIPSLKVEIEIWAAKW